MFNLNFRNVFKKPTPTRFHYTPRFYKGVAKENVYQFKSKYRKDEIEKNYNDFRAHWSEERKRMRTKSNREINLRLVIIIGVLLFVVFYLIGFDWKLMQSLFQFIT